MRLTFWLPRLSRRQRIVRNLLAVVLLAFLTWAVNDFRAPTADIALRWRAEQYGLPAPEVMYRTEWCNDGRMALFRTGDFFGTTMEHRGGGYWTSGFHLTEVKEPVTLLWEEDACLSSITRGAEALFVHTDLSGDARAVCELYLWEPVDISDVRNTWEETYIMEAEPNEHGIYRFAIQRMYEDLGEDTGTHLPARAEELALWAFQKLGQGSVDPDLRCSVKVTFYNEQEEVVHTYEKVLAEGQKTE